MSVAAPLLDIVVALADNNVIGRDGARLRDVGTRARHAISDLLGTPVHLDLHVTVAKDWQRDPKALRKLGF